jgi:hypothetical protein
MAVGATALRSHRDSGLGWKRPGLPFTVSLVWLTAHEQPLGGNPCLERSDFDENMQFFVVRPIPIIESGF